MVRLHRPKTARREAPRTQLDSEQQTQVMEAFEDALEGGVAAAAAPEKKSKKAAAAASSSDAAPKAPIAKKSATKKKAAKKKKAATADDDDDDTFSPLSAVPGNTAASTAEPLSVD